MFLEERFELFLERYLPVVFRLALYVFRRFLDTRDTDAESTMAFLPLKVRMLFKRIVNPC